MPDYERMYFRLMGAVADAVEALEQWNIGQAKEMLITAQQEAEESYLEDCAQN